MAPQFDVILNEKVGDGGLLLDALARLLLDIDQKIRDGQPGESPHKPTRSDVRQTQCPNCGAIPGEPCTGARGKVRESNHRERIDIYLKGQPDAP